MSKQDANKENTAAFRGAIPEYVNKNFKKMSKSEIDEMSAINKEQTAKGLQAGIS